MMETSMNNTLMMKVDKMPNVAVLDGDIIAYRAAFWAETEGCEDLETRLLHDIKAWTPRGVSKVYIATSCSRNLNFRRQLWDAYKRHRDDASRKVPEFLGDALEFVSSTNGLSMESLEADDILGMMASGHKAVAVTIDKDLRSVRGWHWNPDKETEPVLVDSATAEYNFHKQWLTGDTTDNIPGIWKCGQVKASKILDSCSPESMTDAVMYTYEHSKDAEGTPYTYDFCVKMAQCVRILRVGEFDKEKKQPILFNPR